MKPVLLLVILFLFSHSCVLEPHHLSGLPGLWKVDKIKIFKNEMFFRSIEPGIQYWDIENSRSIGIYGDSVLQHHLVIEIRHHSILHIDSQTGKLRDEYYIDRLNGSHLDLFSTSIIDHDHYCVSYHLLRVDDFVIDSLRKKINKIRTGRQL